MEALTAKESETVFRIVDNILRQIFGEKATLMIYQHLEAHYALQKHEFAAKIDIFAQGLESFLSSGAQLIERKILDDICSTYGIMQRTVVTDANEEYDFVSQVRKAIIFHST
ncbi:MAG: hypothetical protein ACE14S_06135 [Candidatus Bathyarchaeia archaeon]